MIIERYQLRLLGKFKKGADPVKAVGVLARRFNIPAEKLEKFFDGRPRTVKKGMTLDQAEKQAAVFQGAGAPVEIDVDFNKEILASGTIPVGKPAPNLEKARSLVWIFDGYFLRTKIISLPFSIPILDGPDSEAGFVESDTVSLGWLLTLFLSLFIAVELHGFLIASVYYHESSALLPRIGMVALFLFLLLYLPKIIRPMKRISIFRKPDGKRRLVCRVCEQRVGTGFTRTFVVSDEDNSLVAAIKKNSFLSTCSCTTFEGRVLFSMDKEAEKRIDDSALLLGGSLRENLEVLGTAGDYLLAKLDPDEKKKMIIRDENGIAVGAFKQGKNCALWVRTGDIPHFDVLAAFAIVLAER